MHRSAKQLDPKGKSEHKDSPVLLFHSEDKTSCPAHIEKNVNYTVMGQCCRENSEIFPIFNDLGVVEGEVILVHVLDVEALHDVYYDTGENDKFREESNALNEVNDLFMKRNHVVSHVIN